MSRHLPKRPTATLLNQSCHDTCPKAPPKPLVLNCPNLNQSCHDTCLKTWPTSKTLFRLWYFTKEGAILISVNSLHFLKTQKAKTRMSVCSSSFKLPNLPNISHQNYNITTPTTLEFLSLRRSTTTNPAFCKLHCVGNNSDFAPKTIEISGKSAEEAAVSEPRFDGGGGDGGAGDSFGGSGGGDGEGNNGEEKEFGPILKFEEVMKEIEAKGVSLPDDMMEAAKTIGIRKLFLLRYLDLQGSVWPLGFLMRYCSMLRDRMLADPSFLFKVGTEIVIDSCCATFAEVQKRGKDFWSEFELYLADLLVGVVVDIALVGMLAPYARIGQPSVSSGLFGRIQHACGSLPSSVFEAGRFSVNQRIATYFYKGVLYGSVGFGCGLIGQGIVNMIMTAKRSIKKSEEDIPVPPLVKSAALWGVFLAVSSNTRYQIINGLERIVEASPLAKQVPPVAMAFTVGVRFANNIYGGMQFVDWAKWSGVQ